MDQSIEEELELICGAIIDPAASSWSNDEEYPFLRSVSSISVSPVTEDGGSEDGHQISSHGTDDMFTTPDRHAASQLDLTVATSDSQITVSCFSPKIDSISSVKFGSMCSSVPRAFPAITTAKKSTESPLTPDTSSSKSTNNMIASLIRKILLFPQQSANWSVFMVPALLIGLIAVTLTWENLIHPHVTPTSTVPSPNKLIETATLGSQPQPLVSKFDPATTFTNTAVISLHSPTTDALDEEDMINTGAVLVADEQTMVMTVYSSSRQVLRNLLRAVRAACVKVWQRIVLVITSPVFDAIDSSNGVVHPLYNTAAI